MSITKFSFFKTLPIFLFHYKNLNTFSLKNIFKPITKVLSQLYFYFQNFGYYTSYINSIQYKIQINTRNKSTYFML